MLLLGRILWSGRETQRYLVGRVAASIHWRVMQTIIQSEAAYSVAVVFNLAAYVAKSNLVLITFAALPPLVVRVCEFRQYLISFDEELF